MSTLLQPPHTRSGRTLRLSRSTTPAPVLTIPQNLICGAVGRVAQVLSMFPVDTLKTRIQVTSNTPPLASLTDALRRGNLYNGAAFSLVGQIPYGMLTFGLYETIRSRLEASFPTVPPWLSIVLAASAGDAIGSLWLTPSEVIKSKTQAGLFATPLAAARATAAQGASFFYQGYPAAIARDIPFRALQLTLYERLRARYAVTKQPGSLTALENLLMGAVAGTITAAATTPLDVIRTRMMSQPSGAATLYKNGFDCVVKTVSREGAGALLKGLLPRCLLIGPSSAVFFLAYEASKSFFRKRSMPAKTALNRVGRKRGRPGSLSASTKGRTKWQGGILHR